MASIKAPKASTVKYIKRPFDKVTGATLHIYNGIK
jgi:hypothetical protein